MYRNVYFHKVVRAAEGMVKLALQRAKRLLIQGRLDWPVRDSVAYKAMTGLRMTIADFRDLDDVSIVQCFKIWATGTDATLASICRGLLFRNVYKTIDLTHLADRDDASALVARAEEAVKAAGGDSRYDLFFDEIANTPYEVYEPQADRSAAATLAETANDGKEILVITPQGNRVPFGQVSPMSLALGKQLTFRRLHVAPAWREAVGRAIA
jgi:HD superfamily phosphohydrolase